METTRTRMRSPRAVALIAAACALAGCTEGRPYIDSSMTEATVSGVVSVRGKPAAAGEIFFNPSNADRIVPPRSAPIGEGGSYTIKTLTGINQVTFHGEVATKNQGVGLIKEYCEVAAGEDNHFDFDLLGEGKKMPYDMPGKSKKRR